MSENEQGPVVETIAVRPKADSAIERRDRFDSSETLTRTETASTAVAATAAAVVQARYVMAMKNRRDFDDVRMRVLRDCKRPAFAKAGWYKKPIGAGVYGLSIRFVESALRHMGNVDSNVMTVYEDETKRIVRVYVADLEANITYSRDVIVEKTVERNKIREGQTVLSSRKNSSGQTTYLVVASEDELLAKEGALVSKATRTLGLRIFPADIREEATEQIKATIASDTAKDPDAERKSIADAFAELSVMPSGLKELLGKDIAQASPAELTDLRALYRAIRDGEATFKDALDNARESRGEGARPSIVPLEDRIKARAAASAAPATPVTPPEPPRELTEEEKDFQRSLDAEKAKAAATALAGPQQSRAEAAKNRAKQAQLREPGADG